MMLELQRNIASFQSIRNEVSDQSGVFIHQLYGPVNMVAFRPYGYLKQEAYPPQPNTRSAYTPSVSSIRVWSDDYATLCPMRGSLEKAEDRVVVERKLASVLGTLRMVDGVRTAVGPDDEDTGGFKNFSMCGRI